MLQVYIATIFLLHGLSPVSGLPFGFFLAILWMALSLPRFEELKKTLKFRFDDGLFGVVYVLGLIPYLWSIEKLGSQNLVYAVWWPAIWFVCFWWIREAGLHRAVSYEKISQAAVWGCVILSLSVLGEFILANTAGRYLSSYIPFSISQFPDANVLGDELKRPRGFSSEAGFTSICLECLIPIAVYGMRKNIRRCIALGILVVPAYLLLFSAASITFLCVTTVIYLLVHSGIRKALGTALVISVGIAFFLSTNEGAAFVFNEVIGRKYAEFGSVETKGYIDTFSRPEAYGLALDLILHQPIGLGWGAISQYSSSGLLVLGTPMKGTGLISIPLQVAAEAGVIGSAIYIYIVVAKLRRLFQIATPFARCLFFSTVWVSLHHCVVLEFWFPMLWLCLALSDVVVARSRDVRRSSDEAGIEALQGLGR